MKYNSYAISQSLQAMQTKIVQRKKKMSIFRWHYIHLFASILHNSKQSYRYQVLQRVDLSTGTRNEVLVPPSTTNWLVGAGAVAGGLDTALAWNGMESYWNKMSQEVHEAKESEEQTCEAEFRAEVEAKEQGQDNAGDVCPDLSNNRGAAPCLSHQKLRMIRETL